ncbi:MAG TPA: MFS transporter [Bryobacteraceae bacterium]|nr:MFS transporter [Bryobacteraceae bacterium]
MSTVLQRARFATSVIFLVHGLLIATWISRIPSVQQALGLSSGVLGMALLAIALGSLISMPFTGGLVARYGSARPTLAGTIALALSLPLIAAASNLWVLGAAMLFYGAAAGAMDVAMNAQAVTVERFYGRPVMSSFHGLFSIGGMVGAALGGAIAAAGVSVTAHFAASMLVYSVIGALAARWQIAADSEETTSSAPSFQLPTRPVFAIGLVAFCILLCEGAIADWTAIYLRDYMQAGPALAAAGYAVFSGTMAIGRLSGDWLTDRLGPERIVRWGSLLAALGLTLALLAPRLELALCGFGAVGLGLAAIIPNVFGAGGRAEGMSAGAGIAAVTTTGYFGFLIGPPLIGWVAEATALRISLFLLVVLCVAASALAGAVRPRPNQQLHPAPAVSGGSR